ncbi:MAG: hypothetical protein QNJ43_07575 [Breoghania sp.]|nr:hypothetical protein [Breoghania sp.]MDJ0930715.1 hypothetical protein [Breoghania sp.]
MSQQLLDRNGAEQLKGEDADTHQPERNPCAGGENDKQRSEGHD